MRIAVQKPLFAWDCLEDSPSLTTIKELLGLVPDGALLSALGSWRGRGRDDYPVSALWGVLLLTVLLRHPTFEATLGELGRNRALRELIGIAREDQVPRKWNLSRFLKVLGREPHLTLLRNVFDQMIQRLGGVVTELGRHTAGDATHLSARSDGIEAALNGLPVPDGGRKEYRDDQGQVTKVIEWFGYKLHLLVDVRHEVILAYTITSATAADNGQIPSLVNEAERNLPAARIQSLAYDKAADDGAVHALLNAKKIAPVIENRAMWKEELEKLLPGHDGRSNVVYDESGTVYCYDVVSAPSVRRAMAYIGHEPARGTLKYRCPAMHAGFICPSHDHCNAGKAYGKTVRVKCAIDLRRFPPIPRATKTFERLYKGRTAVERANARLKVFWGADDGNVTGPERFHALVGVVMVVHAGFATVLAAAPRSEGTWGKMHLSHLARALREKIKL
jgi:hypothetical protein